MTVKQLQNHLTTLINRGEGQREVVSPEGLSIDGYVVDEEIGTLTLVNLTERGWSPVVI